MTNEERRRSIPLSRRIFEVSPSFAELSNLARVEGEEETTRYFHFIIPTYRWGAFLNRYLHAKEENEHFPFNSEESSVLYHLFMDYPKMTGEAFDEIVKLLKSDRNTFDPAQARNWKAITKQLRKIPQMVTCIHWAHICSIVQ